MLFSLPHYTPDQGTLGYFLQPERSDDLIHVGPVGAKLRFATYKHSVMGFGATEELPKLIYTPQNREKCFENVF